MFLRAIWGCSGGVSEETGVEMGQGADSRIFNNIAPN